MQIDPSAESDGTNYKLLTNLVVPRPIAWVTSLGETGVVNLAPFSFFNAVGAEPLYVSISIGRRDDGAPKDTARNIVGRGDFVVHLVTEALLEAMNVSAIEFPPDEGELVAAGLHVTPSARVKTPRLVEAAVALECTLHQTVDLGGNTLVIGRVAMFHVDDALVGERHRIHGFSPVGRMGSPAFYCRTTDRIELPRISLDAWRTKALED